MPQRIPPGPAGTSCLTCKQRHKRCDQRQPECDRCLKGGYECLGYGHIRSAARRARVQQPAASMDQENNDSIRPVQSVPSAINVTGSSSEASSIETRFETLDTVAPLSSYPSNSRDEIHDNRMAQRSNTDTLALTSARKTTNRQPIATSHPILGDSRVGPSPQQLFAFSTRIPRTPFGEPKFFFHSITFEDYVIAHGEMMMERSYFRPIQNQTDRLRRSILARLHSSSFSRWVMFLCARICESFVKGDASQNQIYNRWIGDVERALKSALTQDLASREAQERLGDCLEVQLLKTMMGHCSNTYQVLRTVTPTFLQTVFSNPELWADSHDPTLVPLAPIIASTYHAPAHFTLTDSLSAMAFGLPSQVDYDTVGFMPMSVPVPFEWTHSSPAEFQVILADINACRDKRPGARTREDLERRLLAWQAQPSYYGESWETWMISAWFAVQESWRLALLVYLYMAVYGRYSDDIQVELCTQQIFEVTSMVKEPEPSTASVPFFIQYLMAGICARDDSQRTLVRDRLATVSTTRLWMMRGRDFLPVLEHLWQGAAAKGHPVKWGDYLDSREAVLPVVL
ncbi:fungal Zn(2)-cys(6) binuclear cluster domain protein [Rhizoctonia solani AG-3 Rhs1AP]|uniref:Fungal Zn(2)-cys(6) binuclear cluster domain protein n=2 Tax=Rhizoctonia solani AG-3 TaxID=1086053 RepID=A0A074SF01_9AGAM|nr:fungal Zn(2)-cys(6) binuclear cluster domain protein [Rhizoctonia solani AG-3 Rhs1AP]KEP48612.1 fungal Zn(2)-cys(6) binuclear cluster domain protein [Rhizoctonia solani 123E]